MLKLDYSLDGKFSGEMKDKIKTFRYSKDSAYTVYV